MGKAKTSIGTLVERQSRYVMLFQIPDNKAESVRVALTDTVKRLPEHLWKSLTWDQGTEMALDAAGRTEGVAKLAEASQRFEELGMTLEPVSR